MCNLVRICYVNFDTRFTGKNLIRIFNKLYQVDWNYKRNYSVQIFGILALLKMWLLSQLGENLSVKSGDGKGKLFLAL